MLLIVTDGVTVVGCISALRLRVVLLYSLSGHMEDRSALILIMRSFLGSFLFERGLQMMQRRGENDWTINWPPINSGSAFLRFTTSVTQIQSFALWFVDRESCAVRVFHSRPWAVRWCGSEAGRPSSALVQHGHHADPTWDPAEH